MPTILVMKIIFVVLNLKTELLTLIFSQNAHFHQKYPFSRMAKNDKDTKTSDCNCFGRTLELIFSAFGQATLSQMTKLLAAMILLHF